MAYRPGKCQLPRLLKEKKLRLQDLADRIGMSKQQLSDYANNRSTMSLKNAKTIAAALKVKVDDLYEWIEE